ncbi:hypothetical protein ACIBEA_40440 [Streptomyces sp. NPDC051555]|uniref:hypothetical protein n=1 Tax=Streptomyces sp. NPDC051555 TaxID=3365657 RepID=UPI0037BA7DB7
MVAASEWAEGVEYDGQAENDIFDFCTVGGVTYMCLTSHTAGPETHPTRGVRRARTWARAAWEGMNGLEATVSSLSTAVASMQYARTRLAPAGMNPEERRRFANLIGTLRSYAEEVAGEVEQLAGDHPRYAEA